MLNTALMSWITLTFLLYREAMFCCKCGTYIDGNAARCPNCGEGIISPRSAGHPEEVSPRAVVEGPRNAYSYGQPIDRVAWLRSQRPDLVGVSGWLFWFCLGHAIIQPLALAGSFSKYRGSGSLEVIVLAVASCFTGVWVWLRKPEALVIVKVYLIALMALSGFGVVRYVMHGLNSQGADAGFDLRAMTQMRILCITLGWFLYFKQSQRVLATFGENI